MHLLNFKKKKKEKKVFTSLFSLSTIFHLYFTVFYMMSSSLLQITKVKMCFLLYYMHRNDTLLIKALKKKIKKKILNNFQLSETSVVK